MCDVHSDDAEKSSMGSSSGPILDADSDVHSAFLVKQCTTERCFACDADSDDLFQLCLKLSQSKSAKWAIRLLCGRCDTKISSFYREKSNGAVEDQDVWLFHVLHRHRAFQPRPTITSDSYCCCCLGACEAFTILTSRCCNESSALETKSIICIDCLAQSRHNFLKQASKMPIPDFSTYMFHLLNCK
jgi:hypothetical protein